MSFTSPEGDVKVTKLLDFFIDDTKKGCNVESNEMNLLNRTEYNMQPHLNYIRATGGDLALEKCHFYYIKFGFDEEGKPYMYSNEDNKFELKITCPMTKEIKTIQRL